MVVGIAVAFIQECLQSLCENCRAEPMPAVLVTVFLIEPTEKIITVLTVMNEHLDPFRVMEIEDITHKDIVHLQVVMEDGPEFCE